MHHIKHNVSNSVGLFLLIVYCVASFSSLFLSQNSRNHIHEHEYGISLEKHILLSSACHNSIYHNVNKDCGHSEHFSEKYFKQFLDTEFTLQKAYLVNNKNGVIPEDIYASPSNTIVSGYSICFSNSKNSRGPPIFVI